VSIYSTSGNLRLIRWGGDVVEDAGNFATAGEGWCRVRIQARGRDEGDVREAADPVEEHFLSVWPAPPQSDVVHIADDAFARTRYGSTRLPAPPIQLGPVRDSDHEFGGSPALSRPVLIGHQSWHVAISLTGNGP
jgi:hypothetical protein